MKRKLLILLLFCYQFILLAQQDAWVYLADKPNVASSIANPISILTQKAIDRKLAHGVAIDERDVPVNQSYITLLENITEITVMAKSKWFNALHIRGKELDIKALLGLSFVSSIDFADKNLNTSKLIQQKKQSKIEKTTRTFNYGNAANQIEMIHGDDLHLEDFTGVGITIAVMDAGFPNVNTMTSFKRLRDAGNLLGGYDFIDGDNDVYTKTTSSHGTWVLSTMAGYIANQYVGTAPDASYYLFITESTLSENPVEESFWVEAVERADSLGVDIINTSLVYTTYDNSNYSYTNADMNGSTTFITRGANIAFEKGMLLVSSAGNSGNSSWQIVGAPADASGVLSIGAVDVNGSRASFSSIGSVEQSTLKPDVMAQGQASVVVDVDDTIVTLNGTSFSSPILAGGIACLWQALPNKSNEGIMQLVRESASQYLKPDLLMGYGIPNLQLALNTSLGDHIDENIIELCLHPNPATDEFIVAFPSDEFVVVDVFNMLGKHIIQKYLESSNPKINIASLYKGMYLVKIRSSKTTKIIKFIKQ